MSRFDSFSKKWLGIVPFMVVYHRSTAVLRSTFCREFGWVIRPHAGTPAIIRAGRQRDVPKCQVDWGDGAIEQGRPCAGDAAILNLCLLLLYSIPVRLCCHRDRASLTAGVESKARLCYPYCIPNENPNACFHELLQPLWRNGHA